MSCTLTPPELVTSHSRSSAAKFTITLKQPFLPKRLFKGLVWLCLSFIFKSITSLPGWPHRFILPLHKNQQICSILSDLWLPLVRVGVSDSHKVTPKILLFAVSVAFTAAFPPTIFAEESKLVTPTRLLIPSIELDSEIVPVGWKKVEIEGQTYGQWEVNDNLIGWHNLSAPLGRAGNSVLNGHSNIHARVFRNLNKLKIGDRIIAFAGQQTYVYVVTAMILVQEKGVSLQKRLDNARLIQPTADERLTLITCAQSNATHRLIVIASPEFSYRK